MTRTRAAIVGVLVTGLVVAAVIALSSDGDDGPRTFAAEDAISALLIEWTRVGNDVSGAASYAQVVPGIPGVFDDASSAVEKRREVRRATVAFTGTISDDSVRLQFPQGLFGEQQLNGRLDGDALKLVIPADNGPHTVRLPAGARQDFEVALKRLRAGEAQRADKARSKRLRADAATKAAITRVATAYQKALDPRSPDDPCRYLTPDARVDLLANATPALAARGCNVVIRRREREQLHPLYRGDRGVATINLRQVVDLPGGSGGRQGDGAEVTWRAIPNPYGSEPHYVAAFVREQGQWRVALYE